MLTVPDNLFSSPRTADSKDDFPAPTRPTIATSEPGSTLRLISDKTAVSVELSQEKDAFSIAIAASVD